MIATYRIDYSGGFLLSIPFGFRGFLFRICICRMPLFDQVGHVEANHSNFYDIAGNQIIYNYNYEDGEYSLDLFKPFRLLTAFVVQRC